MADHAKIGPSKAKQWLACTKSISLEQSFPVSESEYAAEGTLAHLYGECCIKIWLQIGELYDHIVKLNKAEKDVLFKPEMKRLMEEYRDYVVEQYAAVLKEHPEAKIFIETRLPLDHIIPGGFGTGDVCIVWNGGLRFIDLKYGKGVKVDAEENPQQMLYALGALRLYTAFKVVNVHITIYQPRLNHIDHWHTTSQQLLAWAYDVAIPAAKAADNGDGVYLAGDHCKFCRAKGACKVFADFCLDIAREEFINPDLLTPHEIANIVLKSSIFTGWIKAVHDDAIRRVRAGEIKLPGLKLVEGISRRKYNNEPKLIKTLLEDVMVSEDEIFKKELIGFGDMETLLGKKNFDMYIGDYVVKPTGAPTLVPLTDKRPELGSTEAAEQDFKDIIS